MLGAVAAEPLWVKGAKLISIPRMVHVPQLYQFGVQWEVPEFYTKKEYYRKYVIPASDQINRMVRTAASIQGRDPDLTKFRHMPIPLGVEGRSFPILGLPTVRLIRGFNRKNDQESHRLDVLVRI